MDWGLALVVIVVLFLVLHMALDLRSLVMQVLHSRHGVLTTQMCERCQAVENSRRTMRHEAIWTAAAVIVLMVHITLDFVG